MTETIESQMATVVARLEELGTEVASLRRALFSLGSNLAGGKPGVMGYLAWHEDQVSKLPPPPQWADGTLRQDGPTLEEFVAAGYKAENYPPTGYAAKSSAPPTPAPVPPTEPLSGSTGASGSEPPKV